MSKTACRRIAIGSILINTVLIQGVGDLLKRHNAVVDANRLFLKKIQDAGLTFDQFEEIIIRNIADDIRETKG